MAPELLHERVDEEWSFIETLRHLVFVTDACQVLADLTDDRLAGMTEPRYPELESFSMHRCLGAVVNEEWEHRIYAERDLDVLEPRPP